MYAYDGVAHNTIRGKSIPRCCTYFANFLDSIFPGKVSRFRVADAGEAGFFSETILKVVKENPAFLAPEIYRFYYVDK